MVSGDISDGVPYAKEARDLARHAHRLLHEESREPSDGDLPDFRAVLRRIDSVRRQLAQERRSDLLRWLERLSQQVEGRRPIPSRSIASRGEGARCAKEFLGREGYLLGSSGRRAA
jgi:hypothetical protein